MPEAGVDRFADGIPGRHELLEALCTDEGDAICQAAGTVDGATPGTALAVWLRRFVAFSTRKRHIAGELLAHVHRDNFRVR